MSPYLRFESLLLTIVGIACCAEVIGYQLAEKKIYQILTDTSAVCAFLSYAQRFFKLSAIDSTIEIFIHKFCAKIVGETAELTFL